MRFKDLNDGRPYTLSDLRKDWLALRREEPENHAESFGIEMLEILMATVNGRNDLEIIGMTQRETDRLITRLRNLALK